MSHVKISKISVFAKFSKFFTALEQAIFNFTLIFLILLFRKSFDPGLRLRILNNKAFDNWWRRSRKHTGSGPNYTSGSLKHFVRILFLDFLGNCFLNKGPRKPAQGSFARCTSVQF